MATQKKPDKKIQPDKPAKKPTKAEVEKQHKVAKKIRKMAAPGSKAQFKRMLAMTQPPKEKRQPETAK